jgi:hypothetical protein
MSVNNGTNAKAVDQLQAEWLSSSKIKDPAIKLIIHQRAGKRQSLTKCLNSLNASFPDSECEVEFYVAKLELLKGQISTIDTEIETVMLTHGLWGADEFSRQTDISNDYSDKLGAALGQLKLARRSYDSSSAAVTERTVAPGSGNLPKLKLPQIELPKFDGQPELFQQFITSFERIIGKFNLTQF